MSIWYSLHSHLRCDYNSIWRYFLPIVILLLDIFVCFFFFIQHILLTIFCRKNNNDSECIHDAHRIWDIHNLSDWNYIRNLQSNHYDSFSIVRGCWQISIAFIWCSYHIRIELYKFLVSQFKFFHTWVAKSRLYLSGEITSNELLVKEKMQWIMAIRKKNW